MYAVLTTEPKSPVAPIDPKATPVLLDDEDEERWLRAPLAEAMDLVAAYPAQPMRVDG